MNKVFIYHNKTNELELKVYGEYEDGYFIDLDEINDKADLLEWIYHLIGKNWININMLDDFIQQVCKIKKWDIYK